MKPLSEFTDREKIWFLQDALLDAAVALAVKGDAESSERYAGYVREMQGAAQVKEPSP